MASRQLLWVLTVVTVLLALDGYLATAQWCAPKLFEARRWNLHIVHTDHGPDIVESMSDISMDMIGNRLASHEIGTRNGSPYSVFHLYYYPAGTLYTVKDGVCTRSPVKGNVSLPCFTWDNKDQIAVFGKEFIGMPDGHDGVVHDVGMITYRNGVGALASFDGEDRVPLFEGKSGMIHRGKHVIASFIKEYIGERQNWSWFFGSVTYDRGIGSLYSFDVEGSIPLFDGKDGVIDGVPTYALNSYTNVTLGIRDPSVFTPPDNCIEAPAAASAPLFRHSLLGL